MSTKKIVTESDVDALVRDGVLSLTRGMILTPFAREHATRKGYRLVYGGGSVPSAEALPTDPSGAWSRGSTADELHARVAAEVALALADLPPLPPLDAPTRESPARSASGLGIDDALCERAIVVATGLNHSGVVAALSAAISECGGDIQDISQTIVSDFFSMIFVVRIDALNGGLTFKSFKERLEESGRAAGCEVVAFHEAILQAMHRV